jgi:uncharacterized coiled-coil DUF342 family protein
MTDEEIITNTLGGLRNATDTLRDSLHYLEKRHEESKLALEAALRERDEATDETEQAITQKGFLRADRDAAIAQAAGLREALSESQSTMLDALLGNGISDEYARKVSSALATPCRVFEGEG